MKITVCREIEMNEEQEEIYQRGFKDGKASNLEILKNVESKFWFGVGLSIVGMLSIAFSLFHVS